AGRAPVKRGAARSARISAATNARARIAMTDRMGRPLLGGCVGNLLASYFLTGIHLGHVGSFSRSRKIRAYVYDVLNHIRVATHSLKDSRAPSRLPSESRTRPIQK